MTTDMRSALDAMQAAGQSAVPDRLYPDGWIARADALERGEAQPLDWTEPDRRAA